MEEVRRESGLGEHSLREGGEGRCIICGAEAAEAVVFVYGQMICGECERGIVSLQTGDADYDHYVERLRVLAEAALLRCRE